MSRRELRGRSSVVAGIAGERDWRFDRERCWFRIGFQMVGREVLINWVRAQVSKSFQKAPWRKKTSKNSDSFRNLWKFSLKLQPMFVGILRFILDGSM
jgi:hypothetical protein